MTPQQQAIAAVLAKLGIPADKIDGAMIDALVQAVGAAAPAAPAAPVANADPNAPKPPVPPAMNADQTPPVPPKPPVAANADQESPKKDEPAKNDEPDDKDPAKMAAKYREAFAREIRSAVEAAVAPMRAQLGSATGKLALAEAAKDRAEVAAFVEKYKDRLHPWELDEKVAKEKGTVTVIDQLLSLPTATVATFAEGKVAPRQAAMRQIENRPKGLARYAEKIPAPTEGATQADEVKAGLAASRLGQQAIKEKETAAKQTAGDQFIAKFAEAVAQHMKA